MPAPRTPRPSTRAGARSPRVAIVVSRYNATVTDALLQGAIGAYLRAGGEERALTTLDAPGAFEVPVLCAAAAQCGKFDAIVALGCIVRGETIHDRVLGNAVTRELARIASDSLVPIGLGVLSVENSDQARARAGGDKGNKGAEAMEAALQTLHALRLLRTGKKPRGVLSARPDKTRSRSARTGATRAR
jgi:6,7-dimethyl-8-ribityllumazine synthase